jgi:hypothetical protein
VKPVGRTIVLSFSGFTSGCIKQDFFDYSLPIARSRFSQA